MAKVPAVLKKHDRRVTLSKGQIIHFRPIQPADAVLLEEFFKSHSEQTVVHRYLAHVGQLSAERIRTFVTLDYERDFALIGLMPYENRERMICVGRYYCGPAAGEAEVALTVHDDFQHDGIGTLLMTTLADIARENGINVFTASVMADNPSMMHLLHKVAGKVEAKLEAGIYEVRAVLASSR